MPPTERHRSFEQQFNEIVGRFASELRQLIIESTLDTIADTLGQMRTGRVASSGIPTVVSGALEAPRSAPRIVVQCPVEGCKSPGIRTLMNFCSDHNRSLGKAEKKRLREVQRKAQGQGPGRRPGRPRKAASRGTETQIPSTPSKVDAAKRAAALKAVECPVPGCKNPGVRAFSNFCSEHHQSIPKGEQKKLREKQRKAQAEPTEAVG